MGRFSVSYNDSFIQNLQPNATYLFTVSTQNDIIEIARPDATQSHGNFIFLLDSYIHSSLCM